VSNDLDRIRALRPAFEGLVLRARVSADPAVQKNGRVAALILRAFDALERELGVQVALEETHP